MRAVLVTGAARGLGAAVVERLRADGYAVLATDLHETAESVGLDVREPGQWAAAAESLVALGEPYREVVTLRFFGELSLDEIARQVDRPLGTVKTQLHRGLIRLRGVVAQEGES